MGLTQVKEERFAFVLAATFPVLIELLRHSGESVRWLRSDVVGREGDEVT